MRAAAIWLCLCLVTNQAAAQVQQPTSGRLAATGHVVGANGQPQPGVPLRVEGPQGKTLAVTDDKGQWFLYNLAPGSYKVQAVGQKDGGDASFSVKQRSVVDRLIGRETPVVKAPAITLDKIR